MSRPCNHRESSIDEHISIGQFMIVRPRKVVGWIFMSSFGNLRSNGGLMYHQSERKDMCQHIVDFG